MQLTTDKNARKEQPIARGVLDYFGKAIAAVANVSFVGNRQHNGDAPMHWAREKSTDHADCIARHLIERGTIDDDGLRHSAKIAWRALALLQLEIEAAVGRDRNAEMIERAGTGEFDQDVYTVYATQAEQPKPTGDFEYDEAVKHARRTPMEEYAIKHWHMPERAPEGVRVYISGPMRGIKDQNFPAFDLAAEEFRDYGCEVVNPADADRRDGGRVLMQKDYAIRDTHALNHCTHIAMLPGWEKSVGATAEFFYARWIGLKILDARDGQLLHGWCSSDLDHSLTTSLYMAVNV